MSSSSLVLNLIALSFLAFNTYSHTIDCSTTHCQNKFINCLPEEDCVVSCTDSESCIGAIINCPMNGNCNVHCLGSHSCENTIIDGTLSFGNLNIVCASNENIINESTDHCKSMTTYGSIRPYTGSMNVMCNGNLHSCINSEINCPYHTRDCTISCNGDSSCKTSNIISPINGDLTINCFGKRSCINGIFNGAKASEFNINGCKSDQSCFDVSLYCPPNNNGHKKCFVEGNDNLGRKATLSPTKSPSHSATISPTIITHTPTKLPTINPTPQPTNKPTPTPIEYIIDGGIKIFAINGWNDINIEYSGNFSIQHGGKMHCGLEYNISCNLASNDWKCNNKNCYNINHNSNNNNKFTPTPTIKSINTKTPWPTIVLFHKKYFGNNDSIINEQNIINVTVFDTKNNNDFYEMYYRNPTVFVFILICLCIVVCICLLWTQARKNYYNNNNNENNQNENEEKYDSDSDPLPPKPKLLVADFSSPSRSNYSNRSHQPNVIEPIDSYERRPYSVSLEPMPRINLKK